MADKRQGSSAVYFALFSLGSFLVFANFYVASTILPLYIVEIGGAELDIGLQTIFFYLTSICCRFYFGPMIDRKGRKLPLVIGAFVFATAPLLFWLSHSVGFLLFARIYQAIGLAAFFSSAATFAADSAPPGRVGLFMGLYRFLFTVALLSGPAAALGIINRFDYGTLFLISFLTGMVALGLILLLKSTRPGQTEHTPLMDTFRSLAGRKTVRSIFYGYAMLTAGYGIIVTYVILYISRSSGFANPGIYFTYFCLAGIVASLGAGHFSDHWGHRNLAWPCLIILGVGTLLLFYLDSIPGMMVVSSLATGVGFSAGVAVFMAWLIQETEPEIRGTVLSIQESVFDLFFGLGAFFFGAVTSNIPMDRAFLLAGVLIFAVGGLLLARQILSGQGAEPLGEKSE